MKLKGYSVTGQEVMFGLEHCPIIVDTKLIALAGVANSELLQLDTIVRGNDEGSIWEGDIVTDEEGNTGIVVYSKGFCMSENGVVGKKLYSLDHILLSKGNQQSCRNATAIVDRTPILFGYKDRVFDFKEFLDASDGKVRLFNLSEVVKASNIHHWTGYANGSMNIYFNSLFQGGTVRLVNNVPATVYLDNGYTYLDDLKL